MSKGSALSRAVRFFRDGDMDEVRVAWQLVNEVVKARLNIEQASKQAGVKRRGRKLKPSNVDAGGAASEGTVNG